MDKLLDSFSDIYNDTYSLNKDSNFSEIYTAFNKSSQKKVILKLIDKKKLEYGDYDYLLSQIEREEKLSQMCKSEYTVELYQKLENENAIIFEYENYQKDLMEYLTSNVAFKDEKDSFKNIIKKIAQALKILNDKGIIHRDIKPSNIFLIDEEDLNSVKLGGFSYAIKIKDNDFEPIGNIVFSAPEMIKNIKYNENCDLWSLGVTLYYLYFNYYPYGLDVDANKIMETIYEPEKLIYRMTGNPCLDILFKRLLQISPKNRMTHKEFFEYVLNDNFMKDENPYIKKYKDLYNEIKDLISKQPEKDPYDDYKIEALTNNGNDDENTINSFADGNHLFDINNCTYILSGKEKYNNIIYYDDNISKIDSVYEDTDKFERNTPGAFILCTNESSFEKIRKEILREIQKDKKKKFNLITTGRNFEFVMKFIREIEEFEKNCIENYCIFCMKRREYLHFKDKYPKLHDDIYNIRNKVIEFIKKTSSEKIKPYSLIKLARYEDYAEKYKNRHYIISQYYGDLTPETFNKNYDNLKKLIKEKDNLKELVRPQSVLLNAFDKFIIDKNIKNLDELIIKEYTKSTFYNDLNKWLNDKMDFSETVAYFASRLMYSLNNYGNDKKMYCNKNNTKIFRGLKISYSDLLPYVRAKGKIILFSSFTSTSEKQKIAENWAGRRDAREMYDTILKYSLVYYITNKHESNWVSNGVKVKNIARYKYEEEVLFQPFSFYLLKDVIIDDKKFTADIILETIGKIKILEKQIKLGNEIEYNPKLNIMQIKNEK